MTSYTVLWHRVVSKETNTDSLREKNNSRGVQMSSEQLPRATVEVLSNYLVDEFKTSNSLPLKEIKDGSRCALVELISLRH